MGSSKVHTNGIEEASEWMERTGCQEAKPGEMVMYLGGPIGNRIPDGELVNFLIGKFQKRLCHWSTRMVTWAGKVTILRHILGMLPSYQLMTLSLTRRGFQELEAVCRVFCGGSTRKETQKHH
ncbi:hypothetical protein R1sor_026867 [Riccia sorocarpa]|uniref:Uncharacterized protein n=1 Tax=Riccia sorocarpa TaxID=122646 RepID=A0ABD3GEQ9_9MARC